jgi:hypothetical protein
LHSDRLALMAFAVDRFVLDSRRVVESDSPVNLFDNPDGVFRTMCEESGITRSQILAAIGRRKVESETIS